MSRASFAGHRHARRQALVAQLTGDRSSSALSAVAYAQALEAQAQAASIAREEAGTQPKPAELDLQARRRLRAKQNDISRQLRNAGVKNPDPR